MEKGAPREEPGEGGERGGGEGGCVECLFVCVCVGVCGCGCVCVCMCVCSTCERGFKGFSPKRFFCVPKCSCSIKLREKGNCYEKYYSYYDDHYYYYDFSYYYIIITLLLHYYNIIITLLFHHYSIIIPLLFHYYSIIIIKIIIIKIIITSPLRVIIQKGSQFPVKC